MLHRRTAAPLVALVRAGAAVVFVLLAGAAAGAQSLTLPSAAPPAAPGIEQHGLYLTAPIVLDGAVVIRVAVLNSSTASGAIASRVTNIQTPLGQLVATVDSPGRETATVYDPGSLRIHIVHSGLADALEAVDAHHPDPLPIVTVTAADAAFNETTIDALATEWQGTLQSALTRALELRQPAAQRQGVARVIRVGVAMLLLSLLVFGARALLVRRASALAAELEKRDRAVADEAGSVTSSPENASRSRRRFLALAIRAVKPEQQLNLYRAVAESLVWGLALGWFAALTWGFTLFPQTAMLARQLARGAFGVVTTLGLIALVNRILDAIIARAAGAWRASAFLSSDDKARQLLRIPTIARAVGGFKAFLLGFVAVLGVLTQVGVPIGSVVTIGGVAAIALSLAAQNFVRDFVNGFLVLFEDQYVVGDFVTINAYSGVVEALTLRMVQIRDMSGDLITIPHSATTGIMNQSRNWSGADFRVPVDPASDVKRALELVRAAIEDIAVQEEWRGAVLEPVQWIGIEALSKDWAIVRAVVKTAPLRQFAFRRELNARVLASFAAGGIALGAQIPGVPSPT